MGFVEVLNFHQQDTLGLLETALACVAFALAAVAFLAMRRRALEEGRERRSWFPAAAILKASGDHRLDRSLLHPARSATETADTLVRLYMQRRDRYIEPAVDLDWPTRPGWPASSAPIGFEFWESLDMQRPVRTLRQVSNGVYRP